jgi:hypothetical protein
MNKENLNKLWEITKKVINYAFLLIVLGTGFYIGKMYSEYFPEEDGNQPTSSTDVSIAIDDKNRIFIIDKDSGEYQVLSDSVGVTIFKMYASRIYNTQPK